MPVSLSAFDTVTGSDEGAALEVRHPVTGDVVRDSEGKALTLGLAGPDSRLAKKAEQDRINRRLKGRHRRGDDILTAEEMDEDNLEILAACTLWWSGFVFPGQDQEPECTPENARLVYERYPEVRRQAEAFRAKAANFMRPSPAS
jgi:hypothetical protein